MTKENRYQILTPSGWQNFDGIRKSKHSKKLYTIETKNNLKITVTYDHKIKTPSGFILAQNLNKNDKILTKHGIDNIIKISRSSNKEFVYDLLDVKNGNEFYTNDLISHNCEFMGSSGTLISGDKLKELVHLTPIQEQGKLKQYDAPEKNNIYVLLADVARGKGLDYSAFSVIDISTMPYQQVCTYKDNMVTPADYASIIQRIATLYNNAYVLVEINDIGAQVSDTLYLDLGYEELLFTQGAGRSGKKITDGFGKANSVDRGIRTTKTVKNQGCNLLKLLVEQNQLIVKDFDTIKELSTFSKKAQSFEAEPGCHDDMVMGLVLFAWASSQTYFRDISDINTLDKLREKTDEEIENELMPFGFVSDGSDTDPDVIRDIDWLWKTPDRPW